MTAEILFYTILTSGIFTGLLASWFKYRLQYSIKQEYDLNIAKYKNELEAKNKAELIAKLLSLWLNFPKEQEELNRLTFEAFLWLPDEIANNLSALLSHEANAPDVRNILASVRKYLLNDKTDLNPEKIIIFTQEYKAKSA